jgi:GAF domain-containing protein
LIDGFSEGYNWTGFYLMKDEKTLEVGPYIGPETSHIEIELNSGICGAAASRRESIIVDNVADDPRFLTCSITTKSEIVVPLLDGEAVIGEIDIDSDQPSFFSGDDRAMLEAIANVIVERLKATA